KVALYPNPSNGFFHVQCETGIQTLRMVNVLGQEELYLENLGKEIQEIKLDGEEFNGIYYLYIKDEQGQEIVQRLSIL
ncbi:MAG: T9SS type A sorting domain-containing protein, partial [Aureispira sp.]